jgi:hypothetical protein
LASALETTAVHKLSPDAKVASNRQPAHKCLNDLRAFDCQMQEYGYGGTMFNSRARATLNKYCQNSIGRG